MGEINHWVYLHSNSEFRYYHDDLMALSSEGESTRIAAIDIDNRIYQGYGYGDMDSGMYDGIDPEDFDSDNEDNEDYYIVIDEKISDSPAEIA